MVKLSYSTTDDQYDSKVFRESLGTIGTGTNPITGENQLSQLQAMVRRGVKHVELNLGGVGKGEFGKLETPDKYGSEQRRTIMKLAKLSNQSLSVHATFGITSFSGITQQGIDESLRLSSIKEIDETLAFAAETAKGGAVVMHLQGDAFSNDKSELNLSEKYLTWLKKNKPDEFKELQEQYFNENPLHRKFINNPLAEIEIKENFEKLKNDDPNKYNKYLELAKKQNKQPWESYYLEKYLDKQKLSPDRSPLILVGDKLEQTQRAQDLVNTKILFGDNENSLNSTEKNLLKEIDIDLNNFGAEDYQKIQAIFLNDNSKIVKNKLTETQFQNLKKKLIISYKDVLSENYNLQARADKVFHKKLLSTNLDLIKLQKDDLITTKKRYSQYLDEINEIKKQEKKLMLDLNKATDNGDEKEKQKILSQLNGGLSNEDSIKFRDLKLKYEQGKLSSEKDILKLKQLSEQVQGLKGRKYQLEVQEIGQLEYQKLDKYNEMMSQYNQQEKHLIEQINDIKSVVDESLEKNTSALSHLGFKALKYQLDLKQKSKGAKQSVQRLNNEIVSLQNKFSKTYDYNKRNKLNLEIQKLKTKQTQLAGLTEYSDIDIINNPLYIAPENMLPGMGSITGIEEFKAALRLGQSEFAERLLGNETEYSEIKKQYEKETGQKIKTKEQAMEVAKRHVAGTFDNAHAAGWLKHFRANEGETEEQRIDRFNNWLNSEVESMVKEGLVKHIHFNDSMGKDDDHNLLGTGVLNLEDLRVRLRKAGLKEALIVEAGGRQGHMSNAFDFLNPTISNSQNLNSNSGYRTQTNVSDWISVTNTYSNRPQYSHYGLNYNTFTQPRQPQQGKFQAQWSNTNFF